MIFLLKTTFYFVKCVINDLLIIKKLYFPCCTKQDVRDIDGVMTCVRCGLCHHHVYKNDYIDFYENMYKIRKESIYIRKYHIKNVLLDTELKNRSVISRDIINRVCKTFDLISAALHIVNKDRKRIILIKFIIHKLFEKWNPKRHGIIMRNIGLIFVC